MKNKEFTINPRSRRIQARMEIQHPRGKPAHALPTPTLPTFSPPGAITHTHTPQLAFVKGLTVGFSYLIHLILMKACDGVIAIIPALQMNILRHKKLTQLTQSLRDNDRWSQG